MALWAVLFLEYWKRKNATLAYRWDCSDYEDIEVSELGWVFWRGRVTPYPARFPSRRGLGPSSLQELRLQP